MGKKKTKFTFKSIKMNHFLKKREDIDACTNLIRLQGLIEHGISAKNFDICNIVPLLTDGDILDMGSSGGSCILENAVLRKLTGRKIGIDLEYTETTKSPIPEIELIKADLMSTPFEAGTFSFITCLSVIEHQVDFDKLAKECARLLKPGGKLFITFDYWPEKVNTTGLKLYDLEWSILSRDEAMALINACERIGLKISSTVDWTVMDAVINPEYCSPFTGIRYTFGIFEFVKS